MWADHLDVYSLSPLFNPTCTPNPTRTPDLAAITGLVSEANFECSETGIALQAMDNSHVALVTVELKANEFEHYRCDRNIPLGISVSDGVGSGVGVGVGVGFMGTDHRVTSPRPCLSSHPIPSHPNPPYDPTRSGRTASIPDQDPEMRQGHRRTDPQGQR